MLKVKAADALTLKKKQKNKQDDRPAVVLVVRHATPGSDLQCSDRTGAVLCVRQPPLSNTSSILVSDIRF